MITASKTSTTRVTPYNEVLGIYMNLLRQAMEDNNFSRDIVIPKTSVEKDVNRAPLIIARRGPVQDSPSTIALSEEIVPQAGFQTSLTGHILNYAIIFESFGGSYAEAENLGNLILEVVLSTGQSAIQSMHESISGARLVSWSESSQTEQTEAKYTNTITISVYMIVGGMVNFN